MFGPLDEIFGHSAFDLDDDGKLDGAEMAFMDEVLFSDEDNYNCEEITIQERMMKITNIIGIFGSHYVSLGQWYSTFSLTDFI